MFYVYCDKNLIMASGIPGATLVNPKLTMEKNSAGQFEFTMVPGNPCYEAVKRMKSEISVYEDNELLWTGRPVKMVTSFYLQKKVTCEGELAYLNDSTQPPTEYHDVTVAQFLEALINRHNSQVEEDRRFELGIVTVIDDNDSILRYTNYESTLEDIKEKLVKRLGGIIRVRHDGDTRYIDYLADYPSTCQQTIRFESNLLDYSRTMSAADVATRVVPLGARLEDKSPIEALEMRLNIEEVNNGSDTLELPEAVRNFGKITKVVTWDDVKTPQALKRKGAEWLTTNQYESLVLECKFADLHFMSKDVDPVRLLDRIQVVSYPHQMDAYFPVTKLSIDLMNPGNTEITLGEEKVESLTSSIISGTQEITGSLEEKPTFSQTRALATKMAKMLLDTGVGGYVLLTPDELYIMEKPTLAESKKYWRWNLNGFAYTRDGGKTYTTAITMDGAILADFITAGTMFADRIRGGTLVIGGADGKDGVLQVKDADGALVLKADKYGVAISGSLFTVDTKYLKIEEGGKLKASDVNISGHLEGNSGKMQKMELKEISADKMVINGGFAMKAKIGTVPFDGATIFNIGNISRWQDSGVYIEVNNQGLRIWTDNGNYINLYPEKGIKTNGTVKAERAAKFGNVLITNDKQIERDNGSYRAAWYDSEGKVLKETLVRTEDPWSANMWAD